MRIRPALAGSERPCLRPSYRPKRCSFYSCIGGGKERELEGRQEKILCSLAQAHPRLVIRAPPHVAATRLIAKPYRGLTAGSLGNFIFDQPENDGALLEVRFFPGSNHAVRLMSCGNLLERSSEI